MLDLRVNPSSHVPPSVQIVEAILDAVASGLLEAGSRLPSVRTGAVEALVNPNTVQTPTQIKRTIYVQMN